MCIDQLTKLINHRESKKGVRKILEKSLQIYVPSTLTYKYYLQEKKNLLDNLYLSHVPFISFDYYFIL